MYDLIVIFNKLAHTVYAQEVKQTMAMVTKVFRARQTVKGSAWCALYTITHEAVELLYTKYLYFNNHYDVTINFHALIMVQNYNIN